MTNHNEVAHNWSHKTGKARNGKRLFYEGDAIYSHGRHFMIARHAVTAAGAACVLFTSAGYSTSTSQHKAIVRRAIPSETPVYYVANPERAPSLSDWESEVAWAADRLACEKRARSEAMKDIHLRHASLAIERANALNGAFKLRQKALTLDSIGAAVTGRAKRLERARKAEAKARKVAAQERFARDAEARAAWLAGNNYWYGTAADGTALLRVKGDELETSQGATVPLAHAVKVFRFVKLCHDTGKSWRRNGHAIRVGNYTLDSIDANGNFFAGCHSFSWGEVARMAAVLGLTGDAGDDAALVESV